MAGVATTGCCAAAAAAACCVMHCYSSGLRGDEAGDWWHLAAGTCVDAMCEVGVWRRAVRVFFCDWLLRA